MIASASKSVVPPIKPVTAEISVAAARCTITAVRLNASNAVFAVFFVCTILCRSGCWEGFTADGTGFVTLGKVRLSLGALGGFSVLFLPLYLCTERGLRSLKGLLLCASERDGDTGSQSAS